MKPGIPWSVKGVDSDAREAAKGAARRSGMTLGEWLNSVIHDSADESAPHRRKDFLGRPLQLEDIARQIAKMVHGEPEPEKLMSERILERLGNSERRMVEALGVVKDQISELGQQVWRRRQAESADDNDRQIHSLFETLRAETASRHEADALRVAIEQVSARVAQGQDMRPLAALESQLATAIQRIARTEQQFSRLDVFESSVATLSEELAQSHATILHQADLHSAAMVAANEEGLAQLRGDLGQLSGRLANCEIALARGAGNPEQFELGIAGKDDFIAIARRAAAAKSGSASRGASGPSRSAIFAGVMLLAVVTGLTSAWIFQSVDQALQSGAAGAGGEIRTMSGLTMERPVMDAGGVNQTGKGTRHLAAYLAP